MLDDTPDNRIFSKCGGFTAAELTVDELRFLNLINYRLYISEEDYTSYLSKLEIFYTKIRKNFKCEHIKLNELSARESIVTKMIFKHSQQKKFEQIKEKFLKVTRDNKENQSPIIY